MPVFPSPTTASARAARRRTPRARGIVGRDDANRRRGDERRGARRRGHGRASRRFRSSSSSGDACRRRDGNWSRDSRDDSAPATGAAAAIAESPTGNSYRWLFRLPDTSPSEFALNVVYFLFGRHAGLLPYMPFAAVSVLLFLLHGRRSRPRWLLLASTAAVALFFLLQISWNWQGGGGFVGNRYFVNVYPAFLFLVTRIRPRALLPAGYALAGLFLTPIVLAPFGLPGPEPTLQMHVRGAPFRWLPLELTLRNVPGYHRVPLGDFRMIGRRELFLPLGEPMWLFGAAPVELYLVADRPLPPLAFEVRSPAPHNRVTVELGGERHELDLGAGEGQRVDFAPRHASARWTIKTGTLYAYRMRIETSAGVPRTWERELPPDSCPGWPWQPKEPDTFFVGAELLYLGSPAGLEAKVFGVQWRDVARAHRRACRRALRGARDGGEHQRQRVGPHRRRPRAARLPLARHAWRNRPARGRAHGAAGSRAGGRRGPRRAAGPRARAARRLPARARSGLRDRGLVLRTRRRQASPRADPRAAGASRLAARGAPLMFDNLRDDTRRLRAIKRKPFPWYVVESLLFETGYQAVVLHRLAHWFKSQGVPALGPAIARLNQFLTGVEIGPAATIGPGLMIVHGQGIVVGGYARIGRNATLLQQVTIGSPSPDHRERMPAIGDDVFIGAGAKVIGAITVGDGSFIGVNAVVAQDVPPGSRVVVRGGVEVTPRRDLAASARHRRRGTKETRRREPCPSRHRDRFVATLLAMTLQRPRERSEAISN